MKGSTGQQNPYYTRWEKNIVAIIYIYCTRAVILLFCDYQDTESESCEIEMIIYKPILTHKNASKDLW